MKFRVLGTTLLLVMASAVYGQRFDVPFSFHVGEKSFAAGTYSVTTDSMSGLLLIRSEKGESMIALPQCRVQAPTEPLAGKLVFHGHGNVYFLSQVWRGGSDMGIQLRKSAAEREIAKTGASTQVTSVYASLR
jgi:hypothetical protein